ncbi:MAG: site-specific DNA-methyltransferase [Boseongicola sp. SB0662_bin_57]|nr:site-specific DNA-methyltransferase [Boseongicola sp. SB0662_bin_57]
MTELNFKGKEFVYNHHLAVPFRPLVPEESKGIGPVALDGNLIVHGDNLHALKALMPLYAGKVDCIFIDPPYNTGNEGWRYNDNVNAPMIREWLESNPVGIEDGLRHDKWCAMMWPRLRLLRELLADDGLLFISIDDIENARLVHLVWEIFGPENFIGQLVWKSRQNKDNRNKSGLSNDHEFIIVVGKGILGDQRLGASFQNPDEDERGPWSSGNMVGMASREARPNLHYDLIDPETGLNFGCPKRGWRYGQERMKRLIDEGRVLWPPDAKGRPREKVFLDDLGDHTNTSSVIELPIHTRDGTVAFERIMGNRDFEFPKPPDLIEFLVSQHPKEDALVLDSFAGSGTTAQAVLQANKRDGGNRRFILIEMEDYADRLTAERVRRVINGHAYRGTQRTELLREKLTWTKLKQGQKLHESVDGIENLHGHEYDAIKKTVTDGELIVTGEKAVEERTDGLGGSFTYCTLGDPIELDKVLRGETLPTYDAIGSVLFHMATARALDPNVMRESEFHLGATEGQHVWLIYRPDLDWLKSPESALTLKRAKEFAETDPEARHLVFAPARYVSQKMLAEQNIPVEFVPLPFALYRIDRS